MTLISAYIGLDVHKNSISVAATPADRSSEADFHKRVPNDVTRLLKELQLFGAPAQVHVCYEAGPTGYGLARRLLAEGYRCDVVAPAKTPKMASDRVKTDRRDAIKLARFLRSGHLTAIRIPTEEEEALRDLIRAREDFKCDESDLRRRLGALIHRHGRIWSGKSAWTKAHMAWLEVQEFEQPASSTAVSIREHQSDQASIWRPQRRTPLSLNPARERSAHMSAPSRRPPLGAADARALDINSTTNSYFIVSQTR